MGVPHGGDTLASSAAARGRSGVPDPRVLEPFLGPDRTAVYSIVRHAVRRP
jgi:hypothetical protein